jgi:hypothetical protein
MRDKAMGSKKSGNRKPRIMCCGWRIDEVIEGMNKDGLFPNQATVYKWFVGQIKAMGAYKEWLKRHKIRLPDCFDKISATYNSEDCAPRTNEDTHP